MTLNSIPAVADQGADPARPQFWDPVVRTAILGGAFDFTQPLLESKRGFKWACGLPIHTGSNTILPPNGPTWCLDEDLRRGDQVVSAGSRHQGGAHVLMGDGSVTFITDSIDAGNANAGTVHIDDSGNTPAGASPIGAQSPYGVWGAMGTRASKEIVGADAFE